ncbi:MAG: dihydrofolate reductase family protein [Alphaproteobacteria bacterium]|nr:dihydrofolate reductase family protein [Alphaproteobacteria bacterium]
MTTGHIFIATSLDGFVARNDHQLDWLMKQKTQGEEHGYETFIEDIDVIVMGKGSYQNVLSFGDWPYKKPVMVMSKSLNQADIPTNLKDKVTLTTFTPPALMQNLQKLGYNRAYIDGGKVVQSFIQDGLVNDIILTLVPILIGSGKRLFGDISNDIDLQLIASKNFPSGLIQTHYKLLK